MRVAAGVDQTYGLKKDGTVVAVGRTNPLETFKFEINPGKMANVVDIKARSWGIIGLCKDGTVVTAGENNHGQQAMNLNEAVKDAVAVGCCEHSFLVLRRDGTIFCVGEAQNTRNKLGWNLGPTAPDA
jgi:alpha-tubulin suppressor-like RCC1 family protein